MKRDWADRLDDAELYAAAGMKSAPPEMVSISADLMYDLVRLARAAIVDHNKQD
jgi:hypothetical protein